MSEFKVGDKVCDPVLGDNGEVYAITEGVDDLKFTYPVRVRFNNDVIHSYTKDGQMLEHDTLVRLHHGHMEPGTGKVTFTPKKEPVYEWQWLKQYRHKWCETTAYYKSEDDCKARLEQETVLLYRIEESKREVKP